MQKEYSVWVMINDKQISLVSDGENFMLYEIAIEEAIKYISALKDAGDWIEVTPKTSEAMRWENGKDDRIVIARRF